MWVYYNPNPKAKEVPDCVVRAISIAMNRPWHDIYWDICLLGADECDMPCSDQVWGLYLYRMGFEPFLLPESCPKCLTINMFCKMYPYGIYIIGTGYHAVAVIDGIYYDIWDSGNVIPTFFWKISD